MQSQIARPTKCRQRDKIKDDETGRAFSTHKMRNSCKIMVRKHEGLGTHGRIISERILVKQNESVCGLDSLWLRTATSGWLL